MSTETLDGAAVKAIEALALKSGAELLHPKLDKPEPGLPDQIPVLVNKQTGAMSGLRDLFEKHRIHPERKKGTAKVTTLESFIDLVDRHKTDDSVIFANTDWTKPSLTSVIDYHRKPNGGDASYGQHRIHYDFPLSEEWQAWQKMNGQVMSQEDFAIFIEDHIAELSAPDSEEVENFQALFGFKVAYPNELQALSRGLSVTVNQNVKSNVVLQSGEGEIVFEEDHRDAQGNKFTVPGLFILNIAPFFLGDTCRIPVRLRYRVRSRAAVWFYNIYRPDKHITEQVRRDLENAASATGLPQFQGAPEMPAS